MSQSDGGGRSGERGRRALSGGASLPNGASDACPSATRSASRSVTSTAAAPFFSGSCHRSLLWSHTGVLATSLQFSPYLRGSSVGGGGAANAAAGDADVPRRRRISPRSGDFGAAARALSANTRGCRWARAAGSRAALSGRGRRTRPRAAGRARRRSTTRRATTHARRPPRSGWSWWVRRT